MVTDSREAAGASVFLAAAVEVTESIEQSSQNTNVHQSEGKGKGKGFRREALPRRARAATVAARQRRSGEANKRKGLSERGRRTLYLLTIVVITTIMRSQNQGGAA